MNILRRCVRGSMVALLVLCTCGCGQTGPLYLPAKQHQQHAASIPSS